MQSSIAALVLVLATPIGQAGQLPSPPPQDVSQPRDATAQRRLVVTYSDGTTTTQLLKPRGGFWRPKFPRQANAPLHDGLPLSALQVDFEMARDIVITVSLKYGSPHQRTIPVATVRLGAEPVRVTDLERFGVDPIVLSLDDFSPAPLVQPTVTSASPLLDVTVDLMRHDTPNYKITFRNRAARAVMAVSFKMYRGEKEVGSGRRKTNRSTPIVEAAGEYTFTLQVGSGDTPGFDRFGVDAVLWDDGRVEGNPELKATERALAAGHAQQLRRVLEILRDAAPANDVTAEPKSLSQVRAAVAALPIAVDAADAALAAEGILGHAYSAQIGKQQVKDAVLQDIDAYVQAHPGSTGSSAAPWALEAQPKYSAWLSRAGSAF
jgi:hypothetical protein